MVQPAHLLVIASLVVACSQQETVRIDICRRGDPLEEVEELQLSFLDESGRILDKTQSSSTGERLTFSIPDEAVEVAVEGLGAGGALVASGRSPLTQSQSCVCFSLTQHSLTACAAVECEVSDNVCRFFDDETHNLVTSKRLVFGDNPEDDIQGTTSDSMLRPSRPEENYGSRPSIDVGLEQVGLLRFDLSALPTTSIINSASIELQVDDSASTESVDFFPVLERWDEGVVNSRDGCTNWTCRTIDGGTWTNPGCDRPVSRSESAIGSVTFLELATKYQLDTPLLLSEVQRWVDQPEANFGLHMSCVGSVYLVSSEGAAPYRPRLILDYRIP